MDMKTYGNQDNVSVVWSSKFIVVAKETSKRRKSAWLTIVFYMITRKKLTDLIWWMIRGNYWLQLRFEEFMHLKK